MLTVSMSQLNSSVARDILQATKNPFVGLFIGILLTALIQSSSTVTSSAVAIVAAGNLTLEQAVPLVMGANIGTTLTSTLVSFSYIMRKKEFKRALSAGIVHDIFNILTVIILLPLELYFKFLSGLAQKTAQFFASDDSYSEPMEYHRLITRPLSEWVNNTIDIPFVTMIMSQYWRKRFKFNTGGCLKLGRNLHGPSSHTCSTTRVRPPTATPCCLAVRCWTTAS